MVLDCLTQVNYGPPSRSSASTSYISETTDTNWTNTTAITKDSSLSTNMVDLMNRHDQSLPPSPVNVEHLADSNWFTSSILNRKKYYAIYSS